MINSVIIATLLFCFGSGIGQDLSSTRGKSRSLDLFAAIDHRDLAAARKAIHGNPGVINLADRAGVKPLARALLNKFPSGVKLLLDAGADPNSGGRGVTPLSIAVASHDLSTAVYLLRKHANPNAVSGGAFQMRPLEIAVHEFDFDASLMVKTLLHFGADPNLGGGNRPVLCSALQTQHPPAGAIKALVLAGAKVNLQCPGEGSPLSSAISHKELDIASLMLKKGANIEARSPYGRTPLFGAVASGMRFVRLLLLHRANVNARSNSGSTPLHEAALSGDPSTIRALIGAGAWINARNKHGRTPYGQAKSMESHVREAQELKRLRRNETVLKELGGRT